MRNEGSKSNGDRNSTPKGRGQVESKEGDENKELAHAVYILPCVSVGESTDAMAG